MILRLPQNKEKRPSVHIRSILPRLMCYLGSLSLALFIYSSAYAGHLSWQAPLTGQLTVLKPFEKPTARWAAGHRGVDLALEANGQVLAPAEGQVIFAGTVVDRQVITLKHPDGRISSFEPVTDPLPVGTTVTAGTPIARLDSLVQHCHQSSCIHWGVREPAQEHPTASKGLDYINPLLLLGLEKPSVLLPIGDDFAA